MDSDRRTPRQRELEILGSFPDARRWDGDYERGVLLSDRIEAYVREYRLIDPFDRAKLKPAAYELSVGETFTINGETRRLDPTGIESIVIPPFGVVIVQTLERLNMPNSLIARWNIRVTWAYQGLLWVGGAQVDPGFCGFLFCPLYNLSDQDVILHYGEPIAQIDFVTTTAPIRAKSKEYGRPADRHRLLIDDYNPHLKSALIELATKRLKSAEEKVQRNEVRFDSATAVTFGTLAILFAAIVLLFEKNQLPPLDPFLFWTSIVSAACAVAALLLIWAFFKSEPVKLVDLAASNKKWLFVLLAFGIVLGVVGLPYEFGRIASQSIQNQLSQATSQLQSDDKRIRTLSCQVAALAKKHSISTCR